ncbi:hypothetical protein PILCRDRAFT_75381 [Piloderma croceum F 1598]|uniref:Major facilitator superfamily (MFS) profile domain-containing protein n=1 Tax=Piloderma croceum (strain F 1598) TaxID=765440 RepID=A0A0C3BME0_PILCF|nr:hypothetical protein PILCRDRAFT_75381 [Piloderma croceum F 1598]
MGITADVPGADRLEKEDDLEKQTVLEQVPANEELDIEHAIVQDDPRDWSNHRKTVILFIVSAASLIGGLATNIQNPANQDIEQKLHASPSEISWSLSLFILVQGNFPLVWAAVSEIKGRKIVYLVAYGIFVVGSIIVATAQSIGLVIGMRGLQAAGSSAVFAIGAATLADIYDPAVRGSKFGVYYASPLLGPSLAPLVAGILTQAFGWRAVFWFLAIAASINFFFFLFLLKDTFRRQRSLVFQTILKRRMRTRNVSTRSNNINDTPTTNAPEVFAEITLSLTDVNPFPPYFRVLQRWNNIAILIPSGENGFDITYSCSRTMSDKYHYDALKTGLVLLAFGIGSIGGSILGGRWSDHILSQLKSKNGGKSCPEMRLESTKLAMWFLPPSVIGYGWVYANVGRSSTAVATNSSFRGIGGFVAAEIAVPLQNAIGDGGLYTIWAGVMIFTELMILLVLYKGGKWRERGEEREARKTSETTV